MLGRSGKAGWHNVSEDYHVMAKPDGLLVAVKRNKVNAMSFIWLDHSPASVCTSDSCRANGQSLCYACHAYNLPQEYAV